MKTSTPAIIAAIALFSAPSARADLIGLYSFDDQADPLQDDSGANHHITGTAGTNPVWGATIGFDGSGAYDFSGDRLIVPININPGVLPQMTWGAWVRTDILASSLYKVMGHDNGAWDRTIGLDNRTSGSFRYTTFTGSASAGPLEGTPGPDNTTDWTFIAASYDEPGQAAAMYVDVNAATLADPLVEVTAFATFGTGWSTFAIGGIRPDIVSESWDGAIDQVFIYDEILTPAKVKAIRDRGLRELLGIPAGDPDILLSPANLFGDLTGLGAGPAPVTQGIQIRNAGATQDLVVSGITISGADAARYSVITPLPQPISAGEEAIVEVRFTPSPAGGSFLATLNVASNDEDTPVATASLNATVTTDPNIELAYASPLFGRMTFNAVPALITRTITVMNTGVTGTLTVNAPVISGANAANYAIVSAPATIAAGAQADIVVSLAPGAAGAYAASLQVTSNDADSAGFSIPLDGSIVIVAPATLTAFYSFDDPDAPLRDDSGNGNDITDLAGTDPVWGSASGFNESGGYEFSGDRLIVPIDINPGAIPQMSWGAWVRTNTLAPALYKVMGHDDGAWDRVIGLDNRNDAFRYTTFTGTGPMTGTPSPVNTTDWTFLAATYDQDAASTTMYFDLDAVTTADPLVAVTGAASFGTGFPTFAIGGIRPDIVSESWDGPIDNVFLYGGILTDGEVKNLRDFGKSAALGSDDFQVTGFQINPNGTVTLTWNSDPGAFYSVLYNFDLSTPVNAWPDDADDVASQGATTTYTTIVSFSANRRVFFAVSRNP